MFFKSKSLSTVPLVETLTTLLNTVQIPDFPGPGCIRQSSFPVPRSLIPLPLTDMFYYISFLRPPPLRANTGEPILITPQISNDLRTEFLEDPIDIYYAWSRHPSGSDLEPTTTRPAKLTSWRPSAAYKAIPVPGPHRDARASGDEETAWRLVLACGTAERERAIILGETSTTPFAVTSMPVRFPAPRPRRGRDQGGTTPSAVKGAKQERIVRSYVLRAPVPPPLDGDRLITFDITEQTSFDLDKKIWDSGIGLSSWLVQLFCDRTRGELAGLRDALFGTDARHVLELGAGTGIVSITLAVLRSTLDLSDPPGTIVTTDLASAMPILQDNITSNHRVMHKCAPRAAVLDWQDESLSPPVQAQLEAGLDVIVMADVTYNTASFPALIATLSRLIQRSQSARDERRPLVLMGYKERHPDERSLWDKAKAIGLDFQQIAQVNGAGGNPVEIWLG